MNDMRVKIALVTISIVPAIARPQERSSYYTEPYQEKALEIYRQSIGFRTAVAHGQVPAFASYLANEFRAGGFADEDFRHERTGAGQVIFRRPGALVIILHELAGR
jgi:hypothetical protein